MKRVFITSVILWVCMCVNIGHAQVNRTLRTPEMYVETVVDSAMLQILTQEFSVDHVHRNPDGTFNTRICLLANDFENFYSKELPYTTVQQTRASVTMATSYADMVNGWNKYPTYSTYLAMMDTFQTRYPNLCKIDTILASTPGGRKILCAHISNNLNDNLGKPSLLYISTMHGDEVVGYYFMLRLIDMLLSNYNTNTKIHNMVNNIDIWICPLYNPDGTYHTGNNTINSSPTSTRANQNNVDLNRSFPTAGANIGSNYQPEISAMMAFMEAHNFTLAANFHGGAQLFNYPWDTWRTSQRSHADAAWWSYIGYKYVDTCHRFDSSYMTEEGGVIEGGDWYVITGSMQDYHNWFLGTRHVTIEVGPKVVNTSTLTSYWSKANHSLLNLIEEANFGVHGIVTDSLTGEPLKATVYVENHDKDHSYVETELPHGDYHRPIKAGHYSITYSAEGYFPKTITTNVSDGAKLIQNVQLVSTDTASCKVPANFVVSEVTGSTASFSWREKGTANEWTLQYSTSSSFAAGTCSEVNVNTTPAIVVTGLTAETEYYARVKAVCGAGSASDWSTVCTFTPTNRIEIGSGTASSNYLPTRAQRSYSLTQQIYTTEELGAAGNIVSIEFYKNNTAGCNRNIDIYMISTAKSSFSSNSDWIHVSNADKVFSGTVNFLNNNWTTIELTTPFAYDGTNNVAIIVDDNTGSSSGSYYSYPSFLTYSSATYQSIYYNSSSSNYNPTSSTLGSASGILNEKNQIRVFFDRDNCFKITAADLPYNEGFENMTTSTEKKTGIMPTCWTLAYEDYAPMADTARPQVFYANGKPASGDYCLFMFGMGILAMPQLADDLDISTLKMSFALRQHKLITQLQVGVMSDLSDETTFTPLATFDNGANTEVQHYVVDFRQYSGNDSPKYIAFRNILAPGHDQQRSVQYIDDISIYVANSADDPDPDHACGIEVPYSQNFDNLTSNTTSLTGITPDCWNFIAEADNATAPQVSFGTDNAQSGNYSLYMTGRGYLALPEITNAQSLSGLSVSFFVRQKKYAQRLQVGVMTDPDDESTFVKIADIYNNGNYSTPVPHTVSLAAYSGNGKHIAFRNVATNASAVSYNWIDDISVFETPAISCGITVPYEQGFENGIPECWTFSPDLEGAAAPQISGEYASSGANSLYMSGMGTFALPEITNVNGLSGLTLTFSVRQRKFAHRIAVGVMTDPSDPNTFVEIERFYNGGVYNMPVEHSVDLGAYSGNGRHIAFRNIVTNSNTVSQQWIDDISIDLTQARSAEVTQEGYETADLESAEEALAPLGVDDLDLDNFTVWPNPTTGTLTLGTEAQRVEVNSLTGQKVAVFENTSRIDISNLPAGVYILKVTLPHGNAVRKIVKR